MQSACNRRIDTPQCLLNLLFGEIIIIVKHLSKQSAVLDHVVVGEMIELSVYHRYGRIHLQREIRDPLSNERSVLRVHRGVVNRKVRLSVRAHRGIVHIDGFTAFVRYGRSRNDRIHGLADEAMKLLCFNTCRCEYLIQLFSHVVGLVLMDLTVPTHIEIRNEHLGLSVIVRDRIEGLGLVRLCRLFLGGLDGLGDLLLILNRCGLLLLLGLFQRYCRSGSVISPRVKMLVSGDVGKLRLYILKSRLELFFRKITVLTKLLL